MSNEIRIEIPEFMTHVAKSKFKHFKINGQAIYNGSLHPRTRALVVEKMHEHIAQYIPNNLDLTGMFPIETSLEFHAPINYGDVSLRIDKLNNCKKLCWKIPTFGYTPNWDADNQWIWGKCFNDVLKQKGIIPDDNVALLRSSGKVEWIETSTLQDRKLVFIIKPYDRGNIN